MLKRYDSSLLGYALCTKTAFPFCRLSRGRHVLVLQKRIADWGHNYSSAVFAPSV